MKAIKLFTMAALATAVFASCSNDEDLAQSSYPADNVVRVTTNVEDITIIRKTKCYRFIKRNVLKRKTKRLRYRCPPEPYSNSVRTDFFSYSNAIILESQQINTSI